jgi:hypothetical protein
MTVLAGSDCFWKYEVEDPCEPDDPMLMGAGRPNLESDEKSLRLHTAIGEVFLIEAWTRACRTDRKLRNVAWAVASILSWVRKRWRRCFRIDARFKAQILRLRTIALVITVSK